MIWKFIENLIYHFLCRWRRKFFLWLQAIGFLLLTDMIEECKERVLQVLVVEVDGGNSSSTSVYSHLLAIRPIKSIQFNVSSRFLTDMYSRIHYIHMQYLKCILTNSGMYLLSVSTLEIIMRGSCSVRRKECKQTRSRSFVRCSLNIIDILPAINYSGPLPKNARHYYITIPLFYYCAASPSWRQWQMLQQSESKVLLLLLSE